MNAPNDNTARKGLRGWWLSPPRSGMQRLIAPLGVSPPPCLWGHAYCRWQCRAAAGIVCLSYGVYGWAAFFLVVGALNLAVTGAHLALAPIFPHVTPRGYFLRQRHEASIP